MNYRLDPEKLIVIPASETAPDLYGADAQRRGNSVRNKNDFYPTPPSVIRALLERWHPRSGKVWEPCAGDGRFAHALRSAGYSVTSSDIVTGTNFFEVTDARAPAIGTNPPFKFIREFIDHAFAIGVQEMALVCPERLWACQDGRAQFERHRPAIWANMDWREDYLGKGGSPDRALAVAIWDQPCAPSCQYEIWQKPTDQMGLL